jgi:hypothetical protein
MPEFCGGYALLVVTLSNLKRYDELQSLVEIMTDLKTPPKEFAWGIGNTLFYFILFYFILFYFILFFMAFQGLRNNLVVLNV